jgi:hypothetical protein
MSKLVMVNPMTIKTLYPRRFVLLLLACLLALSASSCVERIGTRNKKHYKSSKKLRNNFYRGRHPYSK